MRASEFTKQELDEKVNPRVVEPGFTAEKRLGNRYVMKAQARYTGEPGDDLRGLIIKVYDTKAKPTMLNWGIGMTRFVARQDPTTQDWYLVSSTTHVDDRYQRQGLASAMYNWARELGNDIEPSSNRTKMGKHFWEKGAGAGREFVDQPPETATPPAIPTSTAAEPVKAQSLRDRLVKMFTEEQGLVEDSFNGIDITVEKEDDEIMVRARANGRELGHVLFVENGEYLLPQDLEVDERFRGQGIAQTMYDYVKSKGYKIRRSGQQTDAGVGFWAKHRAAQNVWEQDDSEVKSHDFMAGHCHVMALALKQLHPDWQIRAHVGWDDDAADDTEYRVDHVYTVAPDGTAYDCRGKFSNEQQLVGPDATGGVDTQYVNFGPEEIKQAMLRGELKRFTKQDLANAMQVATQAGKQDVSEAPAGYKEIEFVCVNPQFPDATDPALQKKMYRGLKQIDGVVPLWQEWGDYSQGQASLSAIYRDANSRDKILSLAKQLGVKVDLEQAVSDDYVDRAMRGEHEGQRGLAEGQDNLSYIGNCTDDDVIEHVFGDATGFAQAVEEYGDEFVLDDLVVKYDPETDVHSFYYQQQGLTERKQSPLEDFEGLQFRMVNDNDQLFVNAFDSSGGNELGHVTFDIGDGKELDPQNLYVKHKFRSQGIAQIMYDFVKSKGYKIQRSWDQTDAGAGFWDKHRGEERVWENFADGKNPQDKGDSVRHGIPKNATMAELEKASHAAGRKGQLARWQLNMRRGHKK